MKTQLAHESKRIVSLDVFRGLTIMLMILVNAQGSRLPYTILAHAPWHGGTLADLVFPFFLYIVGLTLTIVLNRNFPNKEHLRRRQKKALYASIIKRSLILFVIGLFLNIFPNPIVLGSLRYYGILQRIAICYCVGAILYLHTSFRIQLFIFLTILLSYWFLMTQVPVPGFEGMQLTEKGNWVAYVDQIFFSANHLHNKFYDPEGLLSTIPAIATTLLGMMTGTLLLSSISKEEKCFIMIFLGVICLSFAWLWSPYFPINKNLWSSSYVLWSGGYAFLVFGLCFFIIDILGYKQWSLPLQIFGMNALFIFIVHVILLKIQALFHFQMRNGNVDNLRVVIADYFFGSFSPQNEALLYSLAFVVLNFLIALFLYKRKIFVRL